MPGANLALDESYRIKSTSSKPLHGSLSLAGQTEQQNVMSYFACLPDDGGHLIREDHYLLLGNVGVQDSLAERTREKAEHDTTNRNFGLQTLGSELDGSHKLCHQEMVF